jgi:hypothetical protein
MLFEVHPTPVKGKDGKNIVYVRPAGMLKLSMRGLENYCCRNYHSRYGELTMAFDHFLRAASELMARGYRIDTPIESFVPKLKLLREVTDPDNVKGRDVAFDGVEYNPGKLWNKELEKWSNGFRPANNPNTQEIVANKQTLEEVLRTQLGDGGYTTVRWLALGSKLTYYSARKVLNEWCQGICAICFQSWSPTTVSWNWRKRLPYPLPCSSRRCCLANVQASASLTAHR